MLASCTTVYGVFALVLIYASQAYSHLIRLASTDIATDTPSLESLPSVITAVSRGAGSSAEERDGPLGSMRSAGIFMVTSRVDTLHAVRHAPSLMMSLALVHEMLATVRLPFVFSRKCPTSSRRHQLIDTFGLRG